LLLLAARTTIASDSGQFIMKTMNSMLDRCLVPLAPYVRSPRARRTASRRAARRVPPPAACLVLATIRVSCRRHWSCSWRAAGAGARWA